MPSHYKENVREKAYDQTILPGKMRLTGNRRTLTGLKATGISIVFSDQLPFCERTIVRISAITMVSAALSAAAGILNTGDTMIEMLIRSFIGAKCQRCNILQLRVLAPAPGHLPQHRSSQR